MATPFSSANRTKSFFSQVDQNRPQAAQQKLGGIMGSQSVLQNSTNAQQGENQKVGEATQAVAKNTTQGYGNLSEIGKAQGHVAAQREFAGQATPVLTTTAAPLSAGTQTRAADNAINTATAVQGNKNTTDKYVNAGNALTDRGNAANGTGLAEKQLGETYQTDSDKLRDAQKQMTQGNLGQLAAPSNYELEQQQLAQVLADRQSNVGKLKALYGSGYDSSKFGALDSNLLQGQFNDAQGKAKEGLAGLENAKKGSDRAREQYLNQIDISQGITDKAKTDAEAKIADIGNQINILNDKINNATGDAKKKLTETQAQLEQARDAAEADLKAKDDKANAERQAYNDAHPQQSAQTRADGSTPGGEANQQTASFAKDQIVKRQNYVNGLLSGAIQPSSPDDYKILQEQANKKAMTTNSGGKAGGTVQSKTKSIYSGGKP